jgi:1-deoxy-D-xylulose-5-phosphate reductoisomerase
MQKNIAILGSTGSIGTNVLRVAKHLGKDVIQVTALAAKSNIDLLEQQAKEFHPQLIAVFDKDKALELQRRLPHIPVVGGMEGLEAVATHSQAHMVVSAMSGTVGLKPTISAICSGKDIALANKEVLISGGSLVMALVKKHKIQLIPIDSEHSALFQCLEGQKFESISRLIITASGGPFRNYTKEQLANVNVSLALKHPTWSMGPKVTVDSSTLMNKGLEVIEAHWLFGVPVDKIEVVVHPQSIIHSMVEFVDRSVMAQMGETHMVTPIQFAMTYPKRYPGLLSPFDIFRQGTLQFFPPDMTKFRCLGLAYHALRQGGSLSCYMNSANETLVNRFLKNRISWKDISIKLEKLMTQHSVSKIETLDDILSVDQLAREQAENS